ncbi:MAG TPA: GatB/YqeY domain-containing protein [Haliangiales bacterium]|nr:GatB/YqeY domain-containing protein [Haliangiales bacterium]
MPIEQELRAQLTAAMKAKDQRTADAIRMINTKVMERRTAKGFSGPVDDALHVDVIQAYKKSLQKALAEFEAVGERGRAPAEELRWEIAFCDRFLPQGLSEDELRAAVRSAITSLGLKDPKQAGRVVGEVMKQHKGRVEAAAVKAMAEAEIAKG